MNRKRSHNQDEIEKELSIVYDALDSTINGVIITGIEGKINYVNPAFVIMFEYNERNDIIGKHAHELFVAKEVKSLADVAERIEKLPGKTEEFLVSRMDGTRFWVEVSTSSVTDKNNKTVGYMASFVDVTERKRVEEENRRLSSELMKSHDLERQRLAQDLHDTVAQTIHAAKLNFIAYQKDREKFNNRFNVGIDFIDKASMELREVCNDLYPSILKDYGLESTIRWYVKNYLEMNNIVCDIAINLKAKLPYDFEVNLYRIIKEIFSNIIKHSKADRAVVEMLIDREMLLLNIKDNGTGFDKNKVYEQRKGFGLLNIQHRVNDLKGELSMDTAPGKGTSIIIKIGLKDIWKR